MIATGPGWSSKKLSKHTQAGLAAYAGMTITITIRLHVTECTALQDAASLCLPRQRRQSTCYKHVSIHVSPLIPFPVPPPSLPSFLPVPHSRCEAAPSWRPFVAASPSGAGPIRWLRCGAGHFSGQSSGREKPGAADSTGYSPISLWTGAY